MKLKKYFWTLVFLSIFGIIYLVNADTPTASKAWIISSSKKNFTDDNFSAVHDGTDAEVDTIWNGTDWRFDGSSDMVINLPFEGWSNTTGTNDITSYDYDPILRYNAVCNDSGLIGGSCHFDGAYDSVQFDDAPHLRYADGNFSVSFWFKIGDDNRRDDLVCTRSSAASAQGWCIFMNSNEKIYFYTNNGSADDDVKSISNTLTMEEWHHVVVVVDSGVKQYLYIDGNLHDSDSLGGRTDFERNYGLDIGTAANSYTRSTNGSIDNVQVWNRTLSLNEIKAIYNNDTHLHQDAFLQRHGKVKANITLSDGYEGVNLETEEIDTYNQNTCTPTANQKWDVTCAEDCVATSVNLADNGINLIGDGVFTIPNGVTISDYGTLSKDPNCKIVLNPGGKLVK